MSGLPFAFAYPPVLFALIALPAIWWLLRLIPPKPAHRSASLDAPAARDRQEGRRAGAHARLAD